MKISKRNLNILIESYLNEDSEDVKNYVKDAKGSLDTLIDKGKKGFETIKKTFTDKIGTEDPNKVYQNKTKKPKAIYFCARELGLGYGHAYISIKNTDGTETSYSGKSGIEFSFPAFAKRISLGRTTPTADRKSKYNKKYVGQTDWGALRKLINWDSDEFRDLDTFYVVTDLTQETPEQLQDAAIALEKSFNNYKEDVPYDPVAGMNVSLGYDGPENARNSNSFAYTLLKSIVSDNVIKNIKKQTDLELPGWGLTVPGLRP